MYDSGSETIRRYLITEIARRAEISESEVDADRPLEEFGLASRDAVAIAGELEELLGRALPATLVWEHPTINRIAAALSGEELPAAPVTVRTSSTTEPIAVVGVGCRFPGDVFGPASYWKFLLDGGDAIVEVPEGRWDAFNDGSPETADLFERTTKLGGFLTDIAAFDAQFFGVTPREAQVMDPQQRIALEVAWEALEHAGIAPASLRGSRTGVFMGVSAPEYASLTATDMTKLEAFTATGAALSIVANRLSYLLDLRGPSMIVDTACSSSLVSTHLAVQSLRSGDSDVALAGGVNIILSPTITMTFDQAGGTASDGRCKPFDASADGMVRAEGCGVVVLKRLSDAVAAGDRVLAVIKGTGVNSDGRSNGLVAPNADAQKALLTDVYAGSGLDPHSVDYVEAHGTGTFLGDPIEARSIGAVLGVDRPADQPLLLGSVKSNLGHMESAAGAAGLIKTVLALHHKTIPASQHYKEPNPHIAFDDLHLSVVAEQTPWPARGHIARAGVSAFGFGGTNAHIVLEEAPPVPAAHPEQVPVRTFFLSDTAADRIPATATTLVDSTESLADVAATLRRRNGRGRARAAVVARDAAGLQAGLAALAAGDPHPFVVSGTVAASQGLRAQGGPVWLFSGYGAQRPGMAQSLLQEEPAFAEAIDDLDALFTDEAGLDLWDLLESGRMPEGPAEIMPVLFAVQIGLARMWQAYGVEPAAVVGHSMGEVAAAVVAGSLSLADGVKVIVRRSKLMMRLVGAGSMGVLGCGADRLEELMEGCDDVHPAVFSSPNQTVITGKPDQVALVLERASAQGLLARQVQAEGAGHSPQVSPLLPELLEQLEEINPRVAKIPMYTTALADPRALFSGETQVDNTYWAANLRNPVRLTDAIAAAGQDGHRTFIEINAHPILSHAVGETLEGSGALVTHTLKRAPKGSSGSSASPDNDTDDTLTFHTQLATLAVHGHPVGGPSDGSVIDLPLAPWRHERHWADAPVRDTAGDVHPLLGAHVELPGEDRHAWQSSFLPSGTYAAGTHTQLLPVAALAEMALAASAQFDTLAGAMVHGLEITGHYAGPATLATTLAEDGHLEIHARTPAGTWTQLATAEAVPVLGTLPRSTGTGTLIEPAVKGSKHYRIHPEVLDRCFKALSDEVGEGTWLPAAIAELRVFGPTHRGGHCEVTVDHTDEAIVGSLRLFTPDGTDPLLAISGIVLREALDLPVPLSEKLVEAAWLEEPLSDDLTDSATGEGAITGSAPLEGEAEGADGSASAGGAAGGGASIEGGASDGGSGGRRGTGGRVAVAGRLVVEEIDWTDSESVVRAMLAAGSYSSVVLVPPVALEDEALVLGVVGAARALTSQRLTIVTRGAQAVLPGEAGNPRQGFLRALVRVLGFEHPGLRTKLIDIDGVTAETGTGRTDGAAVNGPGASRPDTDALEALGVGRSGSDGLSAELLNADGGEVAYRGGVRFVARLRPVVLAEGKARKVVRRGGAYIITGGYGGIGLVTARLLAERGAGRIVLTGRSGPDAEAEKAITRLRERGVDVAVELGDIAADGMAARLVSVAQEGGVRLCGILHGAAAMADKLISDIGAEDLHKVWNAKVNGAWKLHEAAPADLDFFLVHSSAASLLGSPGQGSYACANGALDALVAHRRANGLTATAINWGTWSQVGGAQDVNFTVVKAINPAEGAEALEALLGFDVAATGVLRFDAVSAVELFPEIKKMPFFEALVEAVGGAAENDDWAGPEALKEMDPADARLAIRNRVRHRVSAILGFDSSRLDTSTPLTELGLDSLVAVRIKSAVEHDLGLTVPPAILLQGASIDVFEDWAATELGLGSSETSDDSVNRGVRGLAPVDAYVMPRDAAERLAVHHFEKALGLERVSVVDDFFALGGQEHDADRIHALLEEELAATFDRMDLFANPTAEGVADVIRAVEEEAARQTVRPLQPKGEGLPFFAAHPAGGTTGCYQQLAKLIGTAQPFLGLERWEDAPSVEERAARYVEHMLATQPEGPYRIGGWSFGATLAFEIAQQLKAGGHEVGFIALFDGGVPLPTDNDLDNLAHRFAGFAAYLTETYDMPVDLPYEELAGKTEDEMFAIVAERAAPVMASLPPAVLHHQLTSHQDTRTLERYEYKPYDGRVILYKAPLPTPWAVQDPRYVNFDATNGLAPLCSNLEIVEVPGTHHLDLLDPPGVHVIASHLAAQLAHPSARTTDEEH